MLLLLLLLLWLLLLLVVVVVVVVLGVLLVILDLLKITCIVWKTMSSQKQNIVNKSCRQQGILKTGFKHTLQKCQGWTFFSPYSFLMGNTFNIVEEIDSLYNSSILVFHSCIINDVYASYIELIMIVFLIYA